MTRALVTGGGGFLGLGLVRALRARGWDVRALARSDNAEGRTLGAETVRADIRDAEAVARACEGVDVVFHTAAKAGGWGDAAEYEAINVTGTNNVVAGCRRANVPSLVHTSSPSVVFTGGDIEGANESMPLGHAFTAAYPRTKAEAERRVVAAARDGLRTIALRPHFIWGPGDNHLLPRLVARARAGRLRRIGSRDPLVDTTYIDNCVEAHLVAADALVASPTCSGRAFFVSDGAPIGVWTMADRMLACAGVPPVQGRVPAWLAYGLGAALELSHAALGVEREPLMTRFGASELSHAQWFDIGAARAELGYAPRVTIARGLENLAEWCRARDV